MPSTTVIDYTKMPLGHITERYANGRTAVIARCRKCGRRGERGLYIPKPEDHARQGKPYVGITHTARVHRLAIRELGIAGFRDASDHCTTVIDASTVDDLLNVPERKRYDAWRAALIAYVEQF